MKIYVVTEFSICDDDMWNIGVTSTTEAAMTMFWPKYPEATFVSYGGRCYIHNKQDGEVFTVGMIEEFVLDVGKKCGILTI